MATIVTRAGKGSPLTHNEVDANFTNLNTAKAELASPALTGNVTVASNSATAAVTITQIGAGNALVVEDSASPDATPFVVTATGSVGIGTATPATLLHLSSVDPVFITMIDQGNSAGRVGQSGTAMTFGVDGVNGATERMRIDTSGNVGIGTTSPTSNLHVYNANSAISTNEVAAAGTGVASTRWKYGTNQFGLYVGPTNALIAYDYGAAAERMRIDASGNVGIGTSSTSARLEVLGNAVNTMSNAGTEDAATLAVTNSDSSGLGRIAKTLYEIANLPIASVSGVYTVFNGSNDIGGALAFSTQTNAAGGVVERMRIDASGNVGIGTTSPSASLDVLTQVTGALGISVRGRSSDNVSDISLKSNDAATVYGQIQGRSTDLRVQTGTALPITFYTTATERLRIDSAGAIGIGGANYGTSGQVLTSGGSGAAPSWADGINRGTAVASTSGTAITFTGIPSWAKRITMMFNEVSTTGTSLKVVQIGSTTFPVTGYVSRSSGMTTGVSTVSSTSGFVMNQNVAVETFSGAMTVLNIDGNTWVSNHVIGISTPQDSVGAGRVTLSGVLDRIRITTIAGTDTFDAGSVNIMWE